MTLKDEELVERYLNDGDRRAVDELVRRNIGMVRGLVFPMVFDETLVDDLVQEVFLKAIRSLSSFRGKAKFSTWIGQIAMNTAKTHLRRARSSPVSYRDELADVAGESRRSDASDVDELDQDIERALHALAPKLRSAIVLVCLQKRSVEDAAEIEGCSKSTLYWRIHEARKLLKQTLSRHMNHV